MSKTYIATVVMFISSLLGMFQVQLPYTNEQISEAVFVIVTTLSAIKVLYERWKRGDVSTLGFKL